MTDKLITSLSFVVIMRRWDFCQKVGSRIAAAAKMLTHTILSARAIRVALVSSLANAVTTAIALSTRRNDYRKCDIANTEEEKAKLL